MFTASFFRLGVILAGWRIESTMAGRTVPADVKPVFLKIKHGFHGWKPRFEKIDL
jgi:hypothetical protein